MEYKWNLTPPTTEQEDLAKALAEAVGITPIVSRLLVARGITTPEAAKSYFRPLLHELHDPFLMLDMRLGEGSGCPIAFEIIRGACDVMRNMATFEEAEINDDYLEEVRRGGCF